MRRADSQELAPLILLLTELNDLKRIRTADSGGSLAGGLFRRSWSALLDGEDPDGVALREAARALAASRLGGTDAPTLTRGGLSEADAREVIGRGFDAVSAPLSEGFAKELRHHLTNNVPPEPGEHPDFVEALARQPRAGATRPGRPRLILEPPESHAEHCAVVAAYGVLLSPGFGADPSGPFLAGLAHHLHNAYLPDAGFAGEALLGGHLETVMERFTEEALSRLPEKLARRIRASLRLVGNVESPAARAFNAADVIDRVLQMHHHARAAAFTLDQALGEMELIHEGPLKSFHDEILQKAGLLGSTVGEIS